jgi:restriction endonuclease Mrr
MAVPDYETLMRPTLAALADGQPRTRSQLREAVAPVAGVYGDDRLKMLPSGKATVFGSRVGWALTYMSQAGLVTRPKRGSVPRTRCSPWRVMRFGSLRKGNHTIKFTGRYPALNFSVSVTYRLTVK